MALSNPRKAGTSTAALSIKEESFGGDDFFICRRRKTVELSSDESDICDNQENCSTENDEEDEEVAEKCSQDQSKPSQMGHPSSPPSLIPLPTDVLFSPSPSEKSAEDPEIIEILSDDEVEEEDTESLQELCLDPELREIAANSTRSRGPVPKSITELLNDQHTPANQLITLNILGSSYPGQNYHPGQHPTSMRLTIKKHECFAEVFRAYRQTFAINSHVPLVMVYKGVRLFGTGTPESLKMCDNATLEAYIGDAYDRMLKENEQKQLEQFRSLENQKHTPENVESNVADNDTYYHLTIRDSEQRDVKIRARSSTRVKDIVEQYARSARILSINKIRLLFEDEPLDLTASLGDTELEDGDMLTAVLLK